MAIKVDTGIDAGDNWMSRRGLPYLPLSRRIAFLFVSLALIPLAAAAAVARSADMEKGVAEFKSGKYSAAAGHLTAALATDFNDATLHYYLGNCFVRLQQKEKAISEFRIAYALQPDSEVARYSKQALALLGIDMGSKNTDVTQLFILPPPLAAVPPAIVAAGGPELAKAIAAVQNTILIRGLNPLSGGSEHSDQLVPVSVEWRAGEQFDESKLPACSCAGPWFKLPSWIAGIWAPAAEVATQTFFADYTANIERKGESDMAQALSPERLGSIIDSQGTAWQHPCIPDVTRDQSGTKLAVRAIPVEAGSAKVVVYYRWLRFVLDSQHAIKKTTQCELISTYTPISTGVCQKTESLKEFDQLGVAQRLVKYRYPIKLTARLKAPFTDRAGHDFASMFRSYLTENKMLNLMP